MAQSDLTSKFIKTYNNVMTADQCQHLIDKFEDSSSQWVKTELENHRSFTEINVSMHEDWKEYTQTIFTKLRGVLTNYIKDVNIDRIKQWPDKFGFEQIRFKKYEPDTDEFKTHVDVTDYNSARRFLVFFMYLNNNDKGETTFPDYDVSVKPETGKVLVFPPLWTYKHTGEKPTIKPKYIIGSYLHYV